MKVALTGSIAYDYLMSFPGHFQEHILADKLESISLSFLVDKMLKRRGGIGQNIGYTMALLGGDPILFSTVGGYPEPDPPDADYNYAHWVATGKFNGEDGWEVKVNVTDFGEGKRVEPDNQ